MDAIRDWQADAAGHDRIRIRMITAKAIIAIAPASARYADELVKQAAEAGIQANPLRMSCFLGQIHVESGGFNTVVESLNYSTKALKSLFGEHRITHEQADKYGRTDSHPADQATLGNILYGGVWGAKNLGNTQPGDGYRFRGRGLKQLTGRDNYRRFSKAWLGDESLLADPERVARPDGAVASAVWFWSSKGLNIVADRDDVAAVTKVVNGGAIGLADRQLWTDKYRKAWTDKADFTDVTARVL
jgi:putative chitinase